MLPGHIEGRVSTGMPALATIIYPGDLGKFGRVFNSYSAANLPC
jgi:hypothetical protein